MSGAEAIIAAYAAGVRVGIDGDDLVLEASAPPPDTLLELLSRHKPEVVALLRPGKGWTAKDWQALFDERAGIAEFDGGLQRAEAEARAFNFCVVEWLNRHPIRLIDAVGAAVPSGRITCCCLLASKATVTPGCTTLAGGLGTSTGSLRPFRHCR
jgi:hypothetical protein